MASHTRTHTGEGQSQSNNLPAITHTLASSKKTSQNKTTKIIKGVCGGVGRKTLIKTEAKEKAGIEKLFIEQNMSEKSVA